VDLCVCVCVCVCVRGQSWGHRSMMGNQWNITEVFTKDGQGK
jgi:hypothetical protein